MRQDLKVEPILKKVHEQQLKWFGHLTRMNNIRPIKNVQWVKVTGKKKRGRLRKIWEDTTAGILKEENVIMWNEPSEKMQNEKERTKFVHE